MPDVYTHGASLLQDLPIRGHCSNAYNRCVMVLLYWENLAAARTREHLLVFVHVTRPTVRGTLLPLKLGVIRFRVCPSFFACCNCF